jgi:hypothetical protein
VITPIGKLGPLLHGPMYFGASRMVTERDGIILGLIRHLLQRNDLAPDEIDPGRLECVHVLGTGMMTWRLDGKPLAEFAPPEMRWDDSGRSFEFVQRYRVLL